MLMESTHGSFSMVPCSLLVNSRLEVKSVGRAKKNGLACEELGIVVGSRIVLGGAPNRRKEKSYPGARLLAVRCVYALRNRL